jgi:hypothetical protein
LELAGEDQKPAQASEALFIFDPSIITIDLSMKTPFVASALAAAGDVAAKTTVCTQTLHRIGPSFLSLSAGSFRRRYFWEMLCR